MLLSLPQKPREASVDEEGRSLRGLNVGVGAGAGVRLAIGAGVGKVAGIARAEIKAGEGALDVADSGCKIDMVEALSAASSRLDTSVSLHFPKTIRHTVDPDSPCANGSTRS